MDEIQIKAALADLKNGLETKTAQEVKASLDAFELKLNESNKTQFETQLKTVTDALEAKFAADLKVVQDHADKLDVKLQEKGSETKKEDVLVKAKENGLSRKLVAFTSDEKIFPRHGYELSVKNNKIGVVTSGTVSPMLEKPIAMGYVETKYAEIGSEVNFLIRGKEVPAKVVKLPFVKR